MKKLVVSGAALTAAFGAVPAIAAPSIYFAPGVYNYAADPFINPTNTPVVFESFENPPAKNVVGSQFAPGANESVSGVVTVQNGNIPNTTADPDPTNSGGTQYLAIGSNSVAPATSTFTYNFTTPIQLLSFILGSLDTYNTLTLNLVGGGVETFAGGQIIGGSTAGAIPGVNGNGNSSVSGRVTIDQNGGPGVASATFGSTFAAFEIDALSSAVPEPAAWGLMILGVGLMGAQLRTRRRKVTFAAA